MNRFTRVAVASLAALAFAACSDGGPTEPFAGDAADARGGGRGGPPPPPPAAPATVVGNGETVPLVAGQTMEVGTVSVTRVGADLVVLFQITDSDWCITETHVAVEEDLSDIPQTPTGNPKIGRFPYGDDSLDCVSSTEVVVPDPGDGPFYVAAHAVVERCETVDGEGEDQQILFGIFDGDGNGDGDLYAVDPVTGDANIIFDFGADPSGDPFSPNALAFDDVRERLYFTVDPDGERDSMPSDVELYYFDLDAAAPVLVAGGPVSQTPVYNASWYDGAYYFITNNTDDLSRITFDGTGTTIDTQAGVCAGLVPGTSLQFGDIAIEPASGVLYGWARNGPSGDYFFFTIDVDDCSGASSVNVTDTFGTDLNLQLALGEDGTLWGHQALSAEGPSAGQWYVVTKATGAISEAFSTSPSFTDISAGFFEGGGEEVCEDETAWGDGESGARFTTRGNWATYFQYEDDGGGVIIGPIG